VSLAYPQPVAGLAKGAAFVDEVLGNRFAVTVLAVVGAAYAEIATGIDMWLNLDCPPCDRLPAFQDGAHHRRREQDGAFLYFRHDFILAAIAADFEGGGVTGTVGRVRIYSCQD